MPDWPLPRVFAHRCGGALAPENSLAGLRVAAARGIRAVEFDVMLSSDDSPWLIHDETLERTTNGRGRVCDTPDAVLRTLVLRSASDGDLSGEPIPTLEAAAACCLQLGLQANVEIKPAQGFETRTGEVVAGRIMDLWRGASLPLISSFSEAALVAARHQAPDLPIGYLWDAVPEDWQARLAALGGFSLHCSSALLDDVILDQARAAGVPVLCFTVNERPSAEALARRGVCSVFSDRIDQLAGM